MHYPGHIRQAFLDHVENTYEDLEQPRFGYHHVRDAERQLKPLMGCTDIVPQHERHRAVAWLAWWGEDESHTGRLEDVCTYSELAKALLRHIRDNNRLGLKEAPNRVRIMSGASA